MGRGVSKPAGAGQQPTDERDEGRSGDQDGTGAADAGALFSQALELRSRAEQELADAVVTRREALSTAEATVDQARDVARRLQETTATRAEEETLQARERAAGILAGAREEAEQHLTDARLEAARVLDEAVAESVRLRETALAEAEETTERLRVEAEAEVARAFGEVRALVADRAQALEENLGSLQATLARAELSLDHVWVLAGSTVLSSTSREDDAPSEASEPLEDEAVARIEVDAETETQAQAGSGPVSVPDLPDDPADDEVDTPAAYDPSSFGTRPAAEGAKPLSWLFRSS